MMFRQVESAVQGRKWLGTPRKLEFRQCTVDALIRLSTYIPVVAGVRRLKVFQIRQILGENFELNGTSEAPFSG